MAVDTHQPLELPTTLQLSLLPRRLPGRLERLIGANSGLVVPLITGLPLHDGSYVKSFFAINRGNALTGDFVSFRWEKPGYRGIDRKNNKEGEPRAIEIEIISQEEAEHLAESVAERLQQALRLHLSDLQRSLEDQLEKVDQLAINLAEAKTEERRRDLDVREASLSEWAQRLDEELASLERLQADCEPFIQARAEAERLWDALEPYRAALPLVQREDESPTLPGDGVPSDLLTNWPRLLEASGVALPDHVSTSYLLALMTSLQTGGMILLNGPVGVGKTSLVKCSTRLLGGQTSLIPVRPAWLDPSDLLGFFDPISSVYRPTPFITALHDARAQSDTLRVVCLDELNLARIENYGADVLSCLEYSRRSRSGEPPAALPLYSSSIELELWEECRNLAARDGQLDYREKARLNRLRSMLSAYQASFVFPANVAMVGTLNADETTYDLSPKVIDRSYVITYPVADLRNVLPETSTSAPIPPRISVSAVRDQISQAGVDLAEWEQVVLWNEKYLRKLGIPLGHRARVDFAAFSAVAAILGMTEEACVGHFLFMKLLPRVSFQKGTSVGREKSDELCARWLEEVARYQAYGPIEPIERLREQLGDDRQQVVRYWA